MTDLKQLFGAYSLCARFAPGLLFVVALIFLHGDEALLFQDNNVIFVALIVILSGALGFISALLIKPIEQLVWSYFGNPIILHLKSKHKELYLDLSQKRTEGEIIVCIKKITRGDDKLFWKNIAYGFCRNSILLSLFSLLFSYSSKYFIINLWVVVLFIAITIFSAYYYAHQAIESYKEKR